MTQPEPKRDLIQIESEEILQPQESKIVPPAIENDEEAPTWFARTYHGTDASDLVMRYRQRLEAQQVEEVARRTAQERYQRRMEERFQRAKQLAEREDQLATNIGDGHELPPTRRPKASIEKDEGLQRFEEWDMKLRHRQQPSAGPVKRKPPGRTMKIVTAAVLASVVGAGIGFISAKPEPLALAYADGAKRAKAAFALLTTPPTVDVVGVETADVSGSETILNKKTVQTARVAVADVSGALNDPIPLELAAIPASPDHPVSLKITGVPAEAYLTQGTKIGEGQWLVKPQDIDSVEIVIANAQASQIDLSVLPLEEKTGAPAAPAQSMTVALDMADVQVVPASAAPEGVAQPPLPAAVPVPLEIQQSEAQNLKNKGDSLLKIGDLVSARQFYLRAHQKGLAAAAFGVGQTYDPVLYQAMNVRGLQPDQAKAVEWYGKAVQAGSVEASAALQKLTSTAP